MYRSLRKGRTSVYFQHEFTGHNIGAEKYESKVSDGVAILRFSVRPVDGNQKSDEEYLHSSKLLSISVDDGTVVDAFARHVNASDDEISSWVVELVSRGKNLRFPVLPNMKEFGRRRIIEFEVLDGNNGEEV